MALLDEPKLAVSSANGAYTNACCGTIVLRNGDLTLADRQDVRYEVEQDKTGPYVLPVAFVGVLDGNGFQVDNGRQPLKLRLDRTPNPTRIELTDLRRSYVFERQPPDVR